MTELPLESISEPQLESLSRIQEPVSSTSCLSLVLHLRKSLSTDRQTDTQAHCCAWKGPTHICSRRKGETFLPPPSTLMNTFPIHLPSCLLHPHSQPLLACDPHPDSIIKSLVYS